MAIHPTAIVEKGAKLHESVEVGAYAYIGGRVTLGEGCQVMHHATVDGNTTIGKGNIIHPYAYIGGKTQDLKYKGGNPKLEIGENNEFREFCTVHCGTTEEVPTVVGSHNHFLSYSHLAHEVWVGNHVILSNAVQLAGHVVVEDYAIIGGVSAVHQFCRIGAYTMTGGGSIVVKDIPPFMLAQGNHAAMAGINKIGLERNGFTQDEIEDAFRAFKIFRRGHTFENIPTYLKQNLKAEGRVCAALVEFLAKSTRGLAIGKE